MNNETCLDGRASFEDIPAVKAYLDKMTNPACETYSFHNIYHIETFDKDGNKTGENFARNELLNRGINSAYLVHNSDSSDCYYRFGTGTKPVELTDNDLEQYKTEVEYKSSTSHYPIQYHPENGMVTIMKKHGSATLDYNISGWTDDVTFTEVAIRNRYVGVMTRALIDEPYIVKKPNEKLTITVYLLVSYNPKIVQRLWDNGYYAFINFSTETGLLSLHTYYRRDMNFYWGLGGKPRVNDTSEEKYYGGDIWSSNSTDAPFSSADGGSFNSETHLLTSWNLKAGYKTLEDKTIPIQYSYITRGSTLEKSVSQDITIFHPEYLKEPEEFECYDIFTNSFKSSSLIRNLMYLQYTTTRKYQWGRYHLPMFNMDIKEMKMYNHLTKEWDIEENFNNPYWNQYDDYMKAYKGHGHMLCTLNGKETDAYVFINVKADQKDPDGNPACPITSITDDGKTVYTSDTYWDTSSWKLIEDIHNIPEDQQNARYYIYSPYYPSHGSDDYVHYRLPYINRTYRDEHKLIIPENRDHGSLRPNEQGDFIIPTNSISDNIYCQAFSSDTYDWVFMQQSISYLNTDEGIKKYPIYSAGNASENYWSDSMLLYNYDDRIIVTTNGYRKTTSSSYDNYTNYARYCQSHVRLYYTDITNQLAAPEYIDITLNWSNPSNRNGFENWWTFSKNGWAVVWRIRNSTETEVIVIDIYGEDGRTPIQYTVDIENIYWVHTLDLTDNFVYSLRGTDEHDFFLYNMREKTSRKLFTIDSSYSIDGIGGWSHFVYISVSKNSVYSTMCYDIETDTMIEKANVLFYHFQKSCDKRQQYRQLCNEEVLVLVCSGTNNTYMYYITASDYSNYTKIYVDDYGSAYYDSGFGYSNNKPLNENLTYMNEGRQLLLTFTYNYEKANSHQFIIDLGWMIDNNIGHTLIPHHRTGYSDSEVNSVLIPYKDGYVFRPGAKNTNAYWYPIEYFVRHYMRATTTTIQAYNNPKKLGNQSWRVQLTNSFNMKNPLDE